jgi:hypothetical protein
MDNQPYLDQQAPRKHGIPILKIIGTILLICVIICGGLVTYVAYQFPKWAAAFARGPLVTMIEQTSLPDAQKATIKQNITRLADAYQQGRMSNSQFKAILQNLGKGPFFQLVWAESMRYRYGAVHTAMDEERRRTMLAFDQLERGIVEKRIPQQKVSELISLVPDPDKSKDGQKRRVVTEADLKPFIEAMRKVVEETGIPAVPFQPDFAAEIDKAVSAVLGPGALSRPSSSQPAESMPGG